MAEKQTTQTTYIPPANGKRWDVGVGTVVVHAERVLLVRHTYGHANGYWVLPGGFADHDETLDEAAMREVREETGLDVAVCDVIAVRTRHRDHGGAVYVIFRAEPTGGEITPDGQEVDAVRYFSADELRAEEKIMPMMRTAALAALTANGQPGLTETDCPGSSSETYKAFIL